MSVGGKESRMYKQQEDLVLMVDGRPVGFVRDFQAVGTAAEDQEDDFPAKRLPDTQAAFQPLEPLAFYENLALRREAMEEKKTQLCPYKKAVEREYNPSTGKAIVHERFEVCAQSRCMAYEGGKCSRLEAKRNERPEPGK